MAGKLSVGLDLCGIDRMIPCTENARFLARYFTEEESAYILSKHTTAPQTMAGIYAAKEAFLKALGTGIVLPLKDVGVSHDELGAPFYVLTGKALEALHGREAALSVSHDGGVAAAVCVLSGDPEQDHGFGTF